MRDCQPFMTGVRCVLSWTLDVKLCRGVQTGQSKLLWCLLWKVYRCCWIGEGSRFANCIRGLALGKVGVKPKVI